MENIVQTSEAVRPPRSALQIEALNRARVKAQEVRRQNAEIKAKEKAIAKSERDQKVSEINRRFEETQKKTETPPPPENPPEEIQPVQEEEEQEEIVYQKAPKRPPKKRRVVVVQESSSDEEIEVKLPKNKEVKEVNTVQNPFDGPVTFINRF